MPSTPPRGKMSYSAAMREKKIIALISCNKKERELRTQEKNRRLLRSQQERKKGGKEGFSSSSL